MTRVLTVGCVALTLACVTAGGPVLETSVAAAAETPAVQATSTNDGVFTSAQSRRGRTVYRRDCASCHGEELRGGEMAPGIAGSDFIVFWVDLSVGSLFERIKVSMPEDGPGRLSDEEYTDVVAYLLDANDYPSGDTELPVGKAAQDTIMITAAE